VTQKLFGVALGAESAATLVERDPAEARAELGRVQELAREAMEELRSLIFELRPPEIESEGILAALRKHVEVLRRVQGGTPELELELQGEPPREPDRDRELLRIAQEALHNAIRHSGATRIALRLATDNGLLVLEIRDDGNGFDPEAPALRARRLGLTSMEQRARRLSGRLEITSAPGSGTIIRLEAPA
jgi:signal transduction histidine kinase